MCHVMKEPTVFEGNVPNKDPNALKAMAVRQQQQIDTQHQLLAAKEQRLRFLKAQEARTISASIEGEKLHRLRERVEAQETKLRRLRTLRGEVNLQKTYNLTLSNDLDSIRALFSEKEKELCLAVSKVEALTRQLEDLKRDRRGPLSLLQNSNNGSLPVASKELEKLRRELMYRNQLSLQQDARLHLQREALQQRQAELHSVDQRILELHERLNRKKSSNLVLLGQQDHDASTGSDHIYNFNSANNFLANRHNVKSPPNVLQKNILRAYVEPYNHVPNKIVQQVANELSLFKLQQNQTNQNSPVQSDSDENKLVRLAFDSSKNEELSNAATQDLVESKRNQNLEDKDHNESNVQTMENNNELERNNEKKNRITERQKFLTFHQQSMLNQNKPLLSRVGSDGCHSDDQRSNIKSKMLHFIPSGNLVAPPRKPISSVTPTSISNTLPSASVTPFTTKSEVDKSRPALPPKPLKNSSIEIENYSADKRDELAAETSQAKQNNFTTLDNLPIKAKPLTIKKQPLSEQPKLKSHQANKFIQNLHKQPLGNIASTSGLVQEIKTKLERQIPGSTNLQDETDRSCSTPKSDDIVSDEEPTKKKRAESSDSVKTKLARRVSFDPLALLLDASLEGELELVKKTAVQVTNPSAANDEGITALHNAICAGHFDIVKFLVEFGCDVNAQDSDGWSPLHCSASCNNLPMVKFLVESGACLFATTLSDHETPAEKCEEDEEGFDGCSDYLYNIQEKLGTMNNGEVFAVFSYDAINSDELSFSINEKLVILRKGDDNEREWWWAKNSFGQEGYVPRNLLGLYPRIMPSDSSNDE